MKIEDEVREIVDECIADTYGHLEDDKGCFAMIESKVIALVEKKCREARKDELSGIPNDVWCNRRHWSSNDHIRTRLAELDEK